MKIIKSILKAQWQLTPWVVIAVIAFSIIHSSIIVGIYLGFITLVVGNVIHLIYHFFIKDDELN